MRWWLAGILIVMVLVEHNWFWSLVHIVLIIFLLLMLEKDFALVWQACLKIWRILRWLLIPVIVFHVLFTPGAIVWVGFSLPISHEGLSLALYLTLHLSEMFVCAWLLGRLLSINIWLQMIAGFPRLAAYLSPYLRLMPVMSRRVKVLVRQTYQAWRLEKKKVSAFPNYIMKLMFNVEKSAHVRAKYVWRTWDQPKFLTLARVKIFSDKRLHFMLGFLIIYISMEFGVRFLCN